jgi:hypothetical protein
LTDKDSCILCETNKYSSEGAETCTACEEGKISSIGAAYCRTKPEELSEFFFELIGGEENLPIFFALVALAFVGFVVFLMVLSCMSKNNEAKAEQRRTAKQIANGTDIVPSPTKEQPRQYTLHKDVGPAHEQKAKKVRKKRPTLGQTAPEPPDEGFRAPGGQSPQTSPQTTAPPPDSFRESGQPPEVPALPTSSSP